MLDDQRRRVVEDAIEVTPERCGKDRGWISIWNISEIL